MSHSVSAPHGQHVQISDSTFHFKSFSIADPVPTSRQLINIFGGHPVDEYITLAIGPTGDTHPMGLDETIALKEHVGVRFVIFKSDRLYRFEVDRQEREWGDAKIKGWIIKALANIDPATHDLYQEVRGEDPLVANEQEVDLDGKGVERYYTIMSQTTEGLVALPPEDAAHLQNRGIAFETLIDGGQAAVILKDYKVPDGKFSHEAVDVLVLLPAGYPDAVVDMFYCSPWLTLTATGSHPNAANVSHTFAGRNWQRWSRHNYSWRPGIDGIHTVLGRLDRALKDAK